MLIGVDISEDEKKHVEEIMLRLKGNKATSVDLGWIMNITHQNVRKFTHSQLDDVLRVAEVLINGLHPLNKTIDDNEYVIKKLSGAFNIKEW
jgi:hypothetical protein